MCAVNSRNSNRLLQNVIIIQCTFLGCWITLCLLSAMALYGIHRIKETENDRLSKLFGGPTDSLQKSLLLAVLLTAVISILHMIFVTLLIIGKSKRQLLFLILNNMWLISYNLFVCVGLLFAAIQLQSSSADKEQESANLKILSTLTQSPSTSTLPPMPSSNRNPDYSKLENVTLPQKVKLHNKTVSGKVLSLQTRPSANLGVLPSKVTVRLKPSNVLRSLPEERLLRFTAAPSVPNFEQNLRSSKKSTLPPRPYLTHFFNKKPEDLAPVRNFHADSYFPFHADSYFPRVPRSAKNLLPIDSSMPTASKIFHDFFLAIIHGLPWFLYSIACVKFLVGLYCMFIIARTMLAFYRQRMDYVNRNGSRAFTTRVHSMIGTRM